jgi:hypothetical protein
LFLSRLLSKSNLKSFTLNDERGEFDSFSSLLLLFFKRHRVGLFVSSKYASNGLFTRRVLLDFFFSDFLSRLFDSSALFALSGGVK